MKPVCGKRFPENASGRNPVFGLLKKAPARFRKSFGYAWDGFKAAFAKEESFRLEMIAFCLLAAGLCLVSWPPWKKIALGACFILVPMAEMFNSAIEDVCDLVTLDPSPRIKSAKDKGALAVLFAIVVNAGVLAALLLA